ncbi:helix-turn-helix domain-containing protein [Burkholderia contaminans]|nr:helix-turn-helix transcriptional regulator [Burkholderia contaminans]
MERMFAYCQPVATSVESFPITWNYKTMKVPANTTGAYARLAIWLSFLRVARNVTLQSLAEEFGTQRSNLSSFINSGGGIRNISMEKIERVSFALGILSDGTLKPGLHRWKVPDGEAMRHVCDLLRLNGLDRAVLLELATGSAGFLLARVSTGCLVFANLSGCGELGGEVRNELATLTETLKFAVMDRSQDAEIRTLWLTEDGSAVEKGILAAVG